MEPFYVKFGDPSCFVFWISCGKKQADGLNKHINTTENSTYATSVVAGDKSRAK